MDRSSDPRAQQVPSHVRPRDNREEQDRPLPAGFSAPSTPSEQTNKTDQTRAPRGCQGHKNNQLTWSGVVPVAALNAKSRLSLDDRFCAKLRV
jgi:hypothetical protein